MSQRLPALGIALGLVVAGPLAGCRGGNVEPGYAPVTLGNADRGRRLIAAYDCGTCHTIPGVPGARGMVGPPLLWFARRTYIAGGLPNTPQNLIRWISDPPAVEPDTAMPKLGLPEHEARDVAAYLLTLR